MNPIRVYPLKFTNQDSMANSPGLKKKAQPSDRAYTFQLNPPSQQSRSNQKRHPTGGINSQDEKIKIVTQKKLQLLQPSSYSPKKRVISNNDKPYIFKFSNQSSEVSFMQNISQSLSPTKLPNLKRSESTNAPQELQAKIDLTQSQRRSKRTEASNTENTPQNKTSFLKLYQDSSPKLRSIQSRVSSQAIVQDIKIKPKMPQQVIMLHGRSTSQAALVNSNVTEDDELQDFVQLFLSKTQAGQNGNKQTKTNQDSIIISNNFGGIKNRYLFSVCDGHGFYGHHVSQLIKRVLPTIIDQQLKTFIGKQEIDIGEDLYSEVEKTFQSSYQKMTKDLSSCGIDISFSGSTCSTVFVSGNNLWCANIGDSRSVFNQVGESNKWKIVELSNDHKPDLPCEKKRIMASKGRVQPFVAENGQNIGPARVWLLHEQIPGLAMSRSFGDYVASTVGVISDPELIYHKMTQKCGFLVVASDGVWEFLSNDEIQHIICSYWSPQMNAKKIDEMVESIIRESTRRWQEEDDVVDDISIIIAYFS
ncbi:unnamed protein product (macronuclear) [Paramecium tetraurelia]|uniref:PPM-type phosphatase domain-containing protein n=1 Tax=Paramecium tetraurelia TaxID=5888 RepID=A0EIS8_PARTE|nr:uncharacterized protein GSPATT00027548001 [Paramecium tetraurelia]CAK95219.1 unnamed protein product [Paramecium tetraurelia]|eukprot:XP_001462592.1 hypothetical protein (macronuclear) [Paramecium tetraurelia strain d4-2]